MYVYIDVCMYPYIHIYIYIYIYAYLFIYLFVYVCLFRRTGSKASFRWNRLSDTTCLMQAFCQNGESCSSELW